MRSFTIWLIIDALGLSELICVYTNWLLPVNIGLALLSIMFLLYSIARGKRKLMITMSAVPFSLIIAFTIFSYQHCLRMENANKLIHALENYKKAHQRYPASLSELVPEQLAAIPENPFGFTSRNYVYHQYGNAYDIMVETGRQSYMHWLSEEHAWDTYN